MPAIISGRLQSLCWSKPFGIAMKRIIRHGPRNYGGTQTAFNEWLQKDYFPFILRVRDILKNKDKTEKDTAALIEQIEANVTAFRNLYAEHYEKGITSSRRDVHRGHHRIQPPQRGTCAFFGQSDRRLHRCENTSTNSRCDGSVHQGLDREPREGRLDP